MILDILENAHRYQSLNKNFAKAIEFLMRQDLKDLPAQDYEIDGANVYAIIVKAQGRNKDEALLEIHKKYIDIQLVLAGTDDMGWKPTSACKHPSGEYDQDTDVQFFNDEPNAMLATQGGAFAIFFPEDAHMPMISTDELHKVIVKGAV